ncbi:MAG TPA: trimethylamine methyltransferase family protein [Anaerolineae bacterium]|nr:trimethylamine methyltransferase family protein [Anaerolineae bacterium]
MTIERPAIEPIRPAYKVQYLSEDQLDQMQEATLRILEEVGVKFPSEMALAIFSDHGAEVDHGTQIVKIPRDLVFKAMSTVPRYFHVGAREPSCDFDLEDGVTYFTTDGCGVETVDLQTRQRRPSCKADVGRMAHVVDYLSSMAFYWPMVSAQDHGKTAPLHELDASWNNTVKHVQSETLMGKVPARYAIEMATVIAGSREELRRRPVLSLVLCTIAPLVQDEEGIEGALVLAEAGIPVTFLAMPTLGTTSPATLAGALAVGDAEIISGTVLLQLASPGAPVCHSIMQGWADPRSGNYVPYPVDARCRYGPVDMAHHWGMPSFGGAFGTESEEPGTWRAAADVAMDPLLISLAGAEWVTGIGLNRSFTLLYPEAIIMDDELYHRARYALMAMDVSDEALALDVIQKVGPGGHYLAQKHTRKHMRTAMKPGLGHQMDAEGKYRDPLEVSRERVRWILGNYQPEPLENVKQAELAKILTAADEEISRG